MDDVVLGEEDPQAVIPVVHGQGIRRAESITLPRKLGFVRRQFAPGVIVARIVDGGCAQIAG